MRPVLSSPHHIVYLWARELPLSVVTTLHVSAAGAPRAVAFDIKLDGTAGWWSVYCIHDHPHKFIIKHHQ